MDQIAPAYPSWPEAAGGDWSRARARIEKITLLSGDTIEIPQRGVTVIVGANNAGKSTLLSQLNVFLQLGGAQLVSQQPRLIESVTFRRELAPNDLLDWFTRHTTFIDQPEAQGGPVFAVNSSRFPVNAVRAGTHSGSYDALQDLYQLFVLYADATSRLNQPFEVGARGTVGEPPTSPLQRFQDNRRLFHALSAMSEKVFGKPLLLDDYPGATIRLRVGSVELPVPARDEPLGEFGRAVGMLPTLGAQGDGMRSFFGLVIPLVADDRQIILVDEPEAFLHPPQARALGRELGTAASERDMQIVVSTHDKDLISGLLDSTADLTVVRLIRSETETTRSQLSSSKLRDVWDDRSLRYSNVLDGLFARLVVICEAEQDCRFYEAALDAFVTENADDPQIHTIPISDILFVPSNGKGGFARLVGILKELAVPTVVVPDIDLLKSRVQTEALFDLLGGNWELARTRFTVATAWLSQPPRPRSAQNVLAVVEAVMKAHLATNPDAVYDSRIKSEIDDQLRTEIDPWRAVKLGGVAEFRGDARAAVSSLMEDFDRVGMVLVQVGELESFAPTFPKGNEWLPNAIGAEAHRSTNAREISKRILAFHQRASAEPNPA